MATQLIVFTTLCQFSDNYFIRCECTFRFIQLEMDGRKIELPELEGIVILNINSWCGGCELWVNDDQERSSPPR